MNLNICCGSCASGGISGYTCAPMVYDCIHFKYRATSYNDKWFPCFGDKIKFRATATCKKCKGKIMIVDKPIKEVGRLVIYTTCSKCISPYV